MRPTLIAGNWKMNGSRSSVEELVVGLRGQAPFDCQVLLIPPFVFLDQVRDLLAGSEIRLGAQDVDPRENGAVTGGVSASMLREFGCKFTLAGHSERRRLFGESSEMVAEKFASCLGHGIRPILCVGETLEERDRGDAVKVIATQIDPVIDRVGTEGLAEAVIAYEPVWAIGTGKSATPAQADEMHREIRALVGQHDAELAQQMPLLYGGSVNADNAAALLQQAEIDGALVGGASLKVTDFAAICRAAATQKAAG